MHNWTPDPRDQHIAHLEAQLVHAQETMAKLEAQLDQAQELIATLKQKNARLAQRIDELERAGKRQATPFARRKRKNRHKKPGRKAGEGQFKHRDKPAPEEIDQTKEAPLKECPDCRGTLVEMREPEQYEVDIPPVKPVITRFVTHSGYCRQCQRRVRSQPADQTSTAAGAAGVVVGPRAKAMAADMKHQLGLSSAKVCDLINESWGLKVTRSGWYQADQRLAEQARPV